MDGVCVVSALIAILIFCWFLIKHKYAYWANHGIPYVKPTFPYGNLKITGTKTHPGQIMAKYRQNMKGCGPFCGIYVFMSPIVLAIDLDFIRNVLIRDFDYFQDRGLYYNERDDPLSANMLSLDAVKWKLLRSKMTPTFTSGKIKLMLPTILSVANELRHCLNGLLQHDEILDIRNLASRYTTDVIGTCVFGIEYNSLKDPNSKFREMGKKAIEQPKSSPFQRLFMMNNRRICRALRFKYHAKQVTTFFLNFIKNNVSYREQFDIHRNDFMDLLIQLKNEGYLKDESFNKVGHLTIEEVAAQAYAFFLAGFETSSTTITFCLYELAMNKKFQDRAREEINSVLEKYNDELTYEALNELAYCKQILNETLRKYPVVTNLYRSATKDYKVPNTNFTIKKGTKVYIPVYDIHHDPEIYANPDVFDPDRFTPDEISKRPSCSFLAFGDGPRNCIGLRFGMLQTQIGLVMLLKNFCFTTCDKTQIPIEISLQTATLTPKGGLWLNVKALH